MAPVTIHSDSPISATSAKKPSGVTPQTASSEAIPSSSSSSSAAATAAQYLPPTTTSTTAPPPQAQPGAVAGPAPTATAAMSSTPAYTAAAAAPPPTRTLPLQSTGIASDPPAPQPRAAPTASGPPADAAIPPPPAAAPAARPVPAAMPPQFSIPAPASNYAPTHSTDATGAAASLAHPPGYVQNPYAMSMTPAQRVAQAEAERQERSFGNFAANLASSGDGARAGAPAPGGVPHDPNLTSIGEDVNAAWNTAKSWMGSVAGKAAELEGEVWKKIAKE